MQSDTWTFQDYDFLYRNYCQNGSKFVADNLGKNALTASKKASRMGLLYGDYTDEERDTIRKYGKYLNGALVFLMPDRCSYDLEEMARCVD